MPLDKRTASKDAYTHSGDTQRRALQKTKLKTKKTVVHSDEGQKSKGNPL